MIGTECAGMSAQFLVFTTSCPLAHNKGSFHDKPSLLLAFPDELRRIFVHRRSAVLRHVDSAEDKSGFPYASVAGQMPVSILNQICLFD
jgi:hypothetical protein